MSAQRRRAKAGQRRRWPIELDMRWAFRLDRLPHHTIAVSLCTCGRRAWLMVGATEDDWRAYQEEQEAHDTWCYPLEEAV